LIQKSADSIAGGLNGNAGIYQNRPGDAVFFAQYAQEKVFGSDVVMPPAWRRPSLYGRDR
jgi:hypothetical protein